MLNKGPGLQRSILGGLDMRPHFNDEEFPVLSDQGLIAFIFCVFELTLKALVSEADVAPKLPVAKGELFSKFNIKLGYPPLF